MLASSALGDPLPYPLLYLELSYEGCSYAPYKALFERKGEEQQQKQQQQQQKQQQQQQQRKVPEAHTFQSTGSFWNQMSGSAFRNKLCVKPLQRMRFFL